jgi:hypothetical protein
MMADAGLPSPLAGLDDDKVEAQGKVGQRVALEEGVCGLMDARALAVVHGLLGEAEVAPSSPADLDDDERLGRTGIDRDEVELVSPDVDIPPQDAPAGHPQPVGDERLGGIAESLGVGPRSVGHAGEDAPRSSPPRASPVIRR